MDAGNHEEEDHCLGTTQPTRNLGTPSTPRRPLRYHNPRPHQHYYPFGQKHENGHGHAHDRDSLPPQTFFHDSHHQPPAIAAVGSPPAASLATTGTGTATSTSITLDDSLFQSYAASNRNAAHANAVTAVQPNGFLNPDDFYRIHFDDSMASTLPAPRHIRDASLLSNGNTPAPRHPAMSSIRPGVRPSARSVSAPVEDRPSAGAARSKPTASTWNARSGHQPSVKDLTKKFDRNTTQTGTNVVRKVSTRTPAREAQLSEANGRPPSTTGRSSASGSSAGRSSAASPVTRPTQRHRTVPKKNSSSNSQSFASRIAKPRSSLDTRPQASKSMTNLAPASSTTSIPPLPESHGLLFGEVGPIELGAGLAGHGIDGIASRRTREPDTQGTLGRRQRSFSYTNAEPSSPTDWYRSSKGGLGDTSNVGANVSHSTSNHSRSQSELGFTKPVQRESTTPRSSRPKPPALDTSALTSASKIPISVRKYSTPSSSSSPNSTRSNSPSTVRRPFAQGKRFNANQIPAPKIPSPLVSPAMKRKNRPGAITPSGNARLNVYISTPPPKLSPPLRSSRPRQPVSAATTISSRVKAIERDKSPGKRDNKGSTRGNEPTTRRRKISMGPIDYESRREQIKLSYTKSLRENEARAVTRKVAQQRKRKEEEAKALAAQAAAVEVLESQQEDVQTEVLGAGTQNSVDANTPVMEPSTVRTTISEPLIENPTSVEGSPTLDFLPLQMIAADLRHTEVPIVSGNTGQAQTCSPTLFIPGSFPSAESPGYQDEAPPSAISNTTEFDAEPQTDPPVQESPVVHDSNESHSDIEGNTQPSYLKSEYISPFEDEPVADDSLSIKIALDTSTDPAITPGEPPMPENDISAGQEVPVTYQEDEYDFMPPQSPLYETKVTILGRDADFTPPVVEIQDPGSSAPAQEQEDTENHVEADHLYITSFNFPDKDPDQSNDEQNEPSSGLSEIAEFFVGPLLKQHQGRLQTSTATQVDASAEADVEVGSVQQDSEDLRYSVDSKRTLGTRPSLTVPRTSESLNRASQTTIWTDYSVNSQDSSSGYGPIDRDSRRAAFTWREALADSESDSRSESYLDNRNSMAVSNSRDASPCGTYRELELYEPQHQLPEIDTGEEFAAGILSRKNSLGSSAIPVLPSHSPPPPPDDISFHDVMSSAPPSEYYDETRPNSFLHNEKDDQSLILVDSLKRDSDYFAPLESASRSIDQGSFTASEDPQSSSSRLTSQQTLVESINIEQASGLPAKEKKRLFTRLETIKELIDTETFFIRDMNIVEEIYKGTAEACPRLDDKTIKLVFRNTDKIIQFHSAFLVELKEGVSSIYTPRTHRHVQKNTSSPGDGMPLSSASAAASGQLSDDKDRETSLGPIFIRNIEDMKQIHETFLKNSDHAAKRLIQIQEDPTVQVWLNECNEVARELTRAWNLDSLLIKPMQRITKYPNLLIQLLHATPLDHPDRPSLEAAKTALESAIEEINKTKKNFELVGQIVGRRRKESDVKAGLARAFGKRVDKLQTATNKPPEDTEYLKLHEKFGDDYLRLQVVLRDVEFYTRQVTEHVHEFLQYLSSMELVMRLQPSPHPEIESKWVRFNVSMRDIEKVALEQHLSQVRKQVIEPFELVIKSYSNPSLAMKKRSKRRIDYEKHLQLQKSGKKIDKQLSELVEQYEALNEALKKELPKLSALTEKVGNICLGNFVNIQTQWFSIWKEKVKVVLEETHVPEVSAIVSTFFQDYKFQDEQINTIGIINPASKGRPSHSTSVDEASSRYRLRPAEPSPRHRGLSLNSDIAPSLPTPDFLKRHSGQFTASPSIASLSTPNQSYRDYYNGANGHARPPSDSPKVPDFSSVSRSLATPARPGTGQSHDSGGPVRQSVESSSQFRHYASSAQSSPYQTPDNHRFSGIFQSALPMSDAQENHLRRSRVSSRASSRERKPINGYNVLWLAASLFEFNIQTTKHEAGYPYLTYQAGEIFDIIAEKGELWLAKNQDDPNNLVGWLWSKHFAKLADD
ncbi:hypothetical protein F4782DRAFT_277420 [Xylaria castorea]|nr:hypothetical protein F4782DRAFT_277420 [Xylaria castorea]